MKLAKFEVEKIRARIAKCERRIKAGKAGSPESEQAHAERLQALLNSAGVAL